MWFQKVVLSGVACMSLVPNDLHAQAWVRVLPKYVASAIDQAVPDGPLVIAGQQTFGACLAETFDWEGCLEEIFMSQSCQSVGCAVYMVKDSTVTELFRERDGYGIMDVAISPDGKRVAVASIRSEMDASLNGGRAWAWAEGRITRQDTSEQLFAVDLDQHERFKVVGSRGAILTLLPDGSWRKRNYQESCSFYDLEGASTGLFISGWSGIFKLGRRGRLKRIGPSSAVMWASGDGEVLVAANIYADAIYRSDDGGKLGEISAW